MASSSSEAKPQMPVWVAFLIGSLTGPPLYFALIFLVTKITYWINVLVGLFFSLSFTLAGVALVLCGFQFIRETQAPPDQGLKRWLVPLMEKHFLKHEFSHDPRQTRIFEVTVLVPVAALLAFSWASTAYGFARLRPSAYTHPEQLTFWIMSKHYLWQAVDLIPLLDAWKSIHLDDPVRETHLWPGALVILFRLLMVLVVLRAATRILAKERTVEQA